MNFQYTFSKLLFDSVEYIMNVRPGLNMYRFILGFSNRNGKWMAIEVDNDDVRN